MTILCNFLFLNKKMKEIILTDIELRDLMDLEKAANLICKYYENSFKMYDGTINTSTSEYKHFSYLNDIRGEIINEIENRLMTIKL